MRTIIISDLHLGSRYFQLALYDRFMDGLPDDATLVLNGDTVDAVHRDLPPAHRSALDRLRAESRRRRVVWLFGNHDDTYAMDDPAQIEFRKDYSIGKRLYVAHGFDFDNVIPYHTIFVHLFRAMHQVRVLLGAEAVHVAQYAKKWSALYRVLRKSVAMNAVEHAKESGYSAVTCGHTHFMEDVTLDGIRYINTGAWTERPAYYVDVDDVNILLRQVDEQ